MQHTTNCFVKYQQPILNERKILSVCLRQNKRGNLLVEAYNNIKPVNIQSTIVSSIEREYFFYPPGFVILGFGSPK